MLGPPGSVPTFAFTRNSASSRPCPGKQEPHSLSEPRKENMVAGRHPFVSSAILGTQFQTL